MSGACRGCGARLRSGADRCDLCGLSVAQEPQRGEDAAGEAVPVSEKRATPGRSPAGKGSVFCNQCGWENPGGSRFCAQCGARLQDAAAARGVMGAADARAAGARAKRASGSPEPGLGKDAATPGHDAVATPGGAEAGVGRRMAMIFGLAVLVIASIFFVSTLGGGGILTIPSTPPSVAPSSQTPLDDDVAARVDGLREEIAGLSGEERLAGLRRIVDELAAAGRFDRAGAEQEAIAQETNEEADWARAGNLNYDWMDAHDGQERVTFAKAAIAAYRRALEINPDNLDVRTDMAVAYMSDPDNPMLAIQENAAVLAVDSLHVQANFNRGVMLAQISRIDAAVEQFRKVQRIVGNPDDPMFRLAEQAIRSFQPATAQPEAN